MKRPIIFVDTNTIWHRRLAQALSRQVPLVAVNPQAGILPATTRAKDEGLDVLSVTLPRGWASATAFIGQSYLRHALQRLSETFAETPLVILSSPAYAPLAAALQRSFPLVSYTADDYRSYTSWGGENVARKEKRIHHSAALSVFVSEALRDRAVSEFGLTQDRTLVCPNATEPRFACKEHSALQRAGGDGGTLVGMLGGLSERIDLETVTRIVASSAVKRFLIAGPVPEQLLDYYPVLRSPKVTITGLVPHSEMHKHACAISIAVIPYAKTRLNFYCSPMRLYDHIASGTPIFALDGCDQINRAVYPNLSVVSADKIVERIEKAITQSQFVREAAPNSCFWEDRADLLLGKLVETLK